MSESLIRKVADVLPSVRSDLEDLVRIESVWADPSRRDEVQIWREATTVFMTTGHGGCSALGLTLAAHRRGLTPKLWVSQTQTPFLRGVRSESKRQVMELVQADFTAQATAAGLGPIVR